MVPLPLDLPQTATMRQKHTLGISIRGALHCSVCISRSHDFSVPTAVAVCVTFHRLQVLQGATKFLEVFEYHCYIRCFTCSGPQIYDGSQRTHLQGPVPTGNSPNTIPTLVLIAFMALSARSALILTTGRVTTIHPSAGQASCLPHCRRFKQLNIFFSALVDAFEDLQLAAFPCTTSRLPCCWAWLLLYRVDCACLHRWNVTDTVCVAPSLAAGTVNAGRAEHMGSNWGTTAVLLS